MSDWEPSGKCQYDGCDGTRFAYDSGEVPGYGTFYCVKCHGAQIPLIHPQQAASGYSRREAPAPPPPATQEAEELVYHAYVTARELREKHPADCVDIDRVIDGLKAARRFIFNSYSRRT